ncbi:hypothetical protein M422DRAFT_34244 [Sphaerobolus stellatus SS14]|uniref:Uncharacterized protein n=1 Tax=Sphaerobolus stellatus (strain SS14) TaxID=990650 RepID=A0A0C9U109_SPHS4|nr:hypothetical protein M422DRAFT_34244 [Sphaerobolus stellatus SS14]
MPMAMPMTRLRHTGMGVGGISGNMAAMGMGRGAGHGGGGGGGQGAVHGQYGGAVPPEGWGAY